ncbi:sugar diacid recognition domain-containing protein [Actinomycetes bacterium KLBMP 9797]
MLTPAIAQEIAQETSAIIGFNVLITDRAGTVIGSGDPARVGSFHEASVDVVRTLRPASHGAAAAHRLIGVQPGITLPILLDNEAVGTVGLTGDPDQVERFGLLVRNQAEILLRESLLLRSRLSRESAVEDLLRDLAHYDPQVTEPDFIAVKATELGYDLRLRRTVVVFAVDLRDGQPVPTGAPAPVGESATVQAAILRATRRVFPGAQDVVGAVASGRFAVLHHVIAAAGIHAPGVEAPGIHASDVDAPDPAAAVLERCRALADDLGRAHRVVCRIGVGAVATSVAGLHESYRDAASALHLGARLGATITHIDEVRAHDLLAAVPHPARTRFVQATLGPVRDQADWPVTRATLVAWCESGFNLVRAATALRVHRNTLVYRLNKLEASGRLRVRDPRACLTLYLACLLDEMEAPPP